MAAFRVLVSNRTAGSAIHAPTCRLVYNAGPRLGAFPVEAESAEAARREWDERNEVEARRLPPTKICPCCFALSKG